VLTQREPTFSSVPADSGFARFETVNKSVTKPEATRLHLNSAEFVPQCVTSTDEEPSGGNGKMQVFFAN